jgi:Rad52/22 family double-strand break repair protein.
MKKEMMEGLCKEFPKESLRDMEIRESSGKKILLTYIPARLVIERLNECFGGEWSFNVVDRIVELKDNQVAVLGRLIILSDNSEVVKEQWGGSRIDRSVNGHICSLGDNMKMAATDSLKKCASMLGVGLYLYSDDMKEKVEDADPGDVAELQASVGSKKTDAVPKTKKCSTKQADGIRSMLKAIEMDEGTFICILTDEVPSISSKKIEDISPEDAGMILTLKHQVWSKIPKRPDAQVK